MSTENRTEAVNQLFEGIMILENIEECYAFFADICTINELLSLSQRFEVAKMLRDKRTYLEISEQTGASTATISRVFTRIEPPAPPPPHRPRNAGGINLTIRWTPCFG